MLIVNIPDKEFFDEKTNKFFMVKGAKVTMEHSLLSISKWESHYKRCFLENDEGPKTLDEVAYYMRCMTIEKNIPKEVYGNITQNIYSKVMEYISDPMTATTVRKKPGGGRREKLTNELIYYYMIQYGIPFECEKWHLNRLLKLIEVCGAKQGPAQKMSQKDILAENRAIMEARKAKHHTRG